MFRVRVLSCIQGFPVFESQGFRDFGLKASRDGAVWSFLSGFLRVKRLAFSNKVLGNHQSSKASFPLLCRLVPGNLAVLEVAMV